MVQKWSKSGPKRSKTDFPESLLRKRNLGLVRLGPLLAVLDHFAKKTGPKKYAVTSGDGKVDHLWTTFKIHIFAVRPAIMDRLGPLLLIFYTMYESK